MQESKEWNKAAELLATIRNTLGIDGEGGTDPENYSRACVLNREWRMQIKDNAEDSEAPMAAVNN